MGLFLPQVGPPHFFADFRLAKVLYTLSANTSHGAEPLRLEVRVEYTPAIFADLSQRLLGISSESVVLLRAAFRAAELTYIRERQPLWTLRVGAYYQLAELWSALHFSSLCSSPYLLKLPCATPTTVLGFGWQGHA